MKKTTKVVLGSAMSIAMCASLIAGSTLALFSSTSDVNIAVTSGKVDVTAKIDEENLKLYSLNDGEPDPTPLTDGHFRTGGTAAFGGDADLVLTGMVPGDKAEFDITVTNNSTIDVKYQFAVTGKAETDEGNKLFGLLNVTSTTEAFVTNAFTSTKSTKWANWAVSEGDTKTVHLAVELPSSVEDKSGEPGSIQGATCTLTFTVYAMQGNAKTTDPVAPDPSGIKFEISNTTELNGFRDMVDSGESFEGKEIKISDSVEELRVNANEWTPIGTDELPFKGSFDGNGKTIVFQVPEFAKVSATKNENHSLFGKVLGSAEQKVEIKNFTVVNAKVEGDNAGVLADIAENVVFSDITIKGMLQISGKCAGFLAGDFSGSLNNIRIDPETESFVSGSEYAGALCGKVAAGSQISNIYINTNGTADKHFMNSDHTAYLAQPTVNINGKGQVGGIAGHLGSDISVSTVGICANLFLLSDSTEGNKEAPTTIGVFSGVMEGTNSTFDTCYFSGRLVDFVYFGSGFDYESGWFNNQVYCILDKRSTILGNPLSQENLHVQNSQAYFICGDGGGMHTWNS